MTQIASPFFVDEDVAARRRDRIDFRARDALSRLLDPYGAVPWKSGSFRIEMQLAGYVRTVEAGCYLTQDGFELWERATGRSSEQSEADRRRDLVPHAEVLREFGPEVANREARPPRGHA